MAKGKKDLHNHALAAIAQELDKNASDTKAVKGETGRFNAEDRKRMRQKIAQWLFTPEPYRDPVTLKTLAETLGISYEYARAIKRTIPKDVKQFIKHGDILLAVRWPEIAEAIADKASVGSKDHASIARTVKESVQHEHVSPVEPKMPEKIREAFMKSPEHLKRMEQIAAKQKNEQHNPTERVLETLPAPEGTA